MLASLTVTQHCQPLFLILGLSPQTTNQQLHSSGDGCTRPLALAERTDGNASHSYFRPRRKHQRISDANQYTINPNCWNITMLLWAQNMRGVSAGCSCSLHFPTGTHRLRVMHERFCALSPSHVIKDSLSLKNS